MSGKRVFAIWVGNAMMHHVIKAPAQRSSGDFLGVHTLHCLGLTVILARHDEQDKKPLVNPNHNSCLALFLCEL